MERRSSDDRRCRRHCTSHPGGTGLAVLVFVSLLGIGPLQADEGGSRVVHVIDFSGHPEGDALSWLKEQGFELELDAEALNPRFDERGLLLETNRRAAGLFAKDLALTEASRIRVEWGVDRHPQGANWEEGVYRVPIAVMVFFGTEEITSGSWFVPNSPYFISLFLGQNAREGKAYTANYYHRGGRYFCQPCGAALEATVTTEFDLDAAFKEEFEESSVPPISGFAFQMNTKNTEGDARAFLKRIEFLKE